MKKTALINTSPTNDIVTIRCALIDSSESLLSMDADRVDRPHIQRNLSCLLDSVYLGQVTAKAGPSYWIQLTPHCEGLLPHEKGSTQLTVGESVLVQVRREVFYDPAEEGFKAPLLTRKISYAGAACVYTPPIHPKEATNDENFFRLRTHPAPIDILTEQARLHTLHQNILTQIQHSKSPLCLLHGPTVWQRFLRDLRPVERILVDDLALVPLVQNYCHHWRPDLVTLIKRHHGNIFEEYGVADAYEDLFSQKISFRNGTVQGSFFIEETSVAITIDINGGVGQPLDAKGINLGAVDAIARQIKQRTLSGRLIIDFINSADGHRQMIEAAFKQAFEGSPNHTQILGWSRLGWLELTSEKRRTPLTQRLLTSI